MHTACVAWAAGSAGRQLLNDPIKDLEYPKEDCSY